MANEEMSADPLACFGPEPEPHAPAKPWVAARGKRGPYGARTVPVEERTGTPSQLAALRWVPDAGLDAACLAIGARAEWVRRGRGLAVAWRGAPALPRPRIWARKVGFTGRHNWEYAGTAYPCRGE